MKFFVLFTVLAYPAWGSVPRDVSYYQDIKPLVEAKCQICHSQEGVSFSFEDPQWTINFGPAMVAAVSEKRMPPWLAEGGHRSYVDDYSLKEQEVSLFKAWKTNNFAAGEPTDEDVKPQPKQSTFNADLSLLVNEGAAYLPRQDRKDDYRCFLMEWPYQQKSFITGFKGQPGNTKVAHHLVLFSAPPELAPILKDLASQEKGPGYQCFGGGFPDRISDPKLAKKLEAQRPGVLKELNSKIHWVAHWAPGMDGYYFPKGSGIPVRPGSLIIVQMHYFSAFAPGEKDQGSKMEFTVVDQVETPGVNLPVTKTSWLLSRKNKSMLVPAGNEATYRVAVPIEKLRLRAADHLGVKSTEILSLDLHSVNLHMHAIGKRGAVYLENKWGKIDTLLSIPRWDLNWQRDFVLKESLPILAESMVDTKMVVECTFLNPKPQVVFGGFGSDDEMCFNFSYFVVNLKNPAAH